MSRTLYLVAYDIQQPRRRARACRYFKSYRVAGQKSVPEIWVTPAELQNIKADIQALIDPNADRIQIIALDPRMQPMLLGQGQCFNHPYFCIT